MPVFKARRASHPRPQCCSLTHVAEPGANRLGATRGITMRDPQLERINNRIDNLLDDLTVLKGLERSGSDVSAYIQTVSRELQQLNQRKQGQVHVQSQ